MFDLRNKTLTQGEKTEPFKDFRVVFRTPIGWCDTLNQAVKVCEERDLVPDHCILPVAAVFTETMMEIL